MESSPSFGSELRRRREAANISLGQFAAMIHYSKGHLSKIENGLKRPSTELAVRFDAALGAGGGLARLVPPHGEGEEEPPGEQPAVPARHTWLIEMPPDGTNRFISVDNIPGLPPTPSVVLGLRAPALLSDTEPTLAAYRELLTSIRRLGQTTSPNGVLPSLLVYTNGLKSLASSARGKEGHQFLLLAAHFTEYAGWLAQESGSNSAALWLTSEAAALASASGDREIPSYALVRRALISLYARDGRQTIALAEQASENGSASPQVRGLALQRAAQGYALTGDHYRCMMGLDRASMLLSRVEGGDGTGRPQLGSMHVANPVEAARGWCLYELGRPDAAVGYLATALAGIPAHAHRSRARFGARQALALSAMGEIPQACATASDVLRLAVATDSATIRDDLRRLRQGLHRWRSHREVRELLPRLGEAVRPVPAI